MPRSRHLVKSLARDRNSSQVKQHSTSKRKLQLQSSQIRSILKNVSLNQYISAVSDVLGEKFVAKHRENSAEENIRPDSLTLQALMNCSSEKTTNCSKMQVLKKKHVKFSDVVQAFSIGDGWKMSTFVEKLKSEVDQQDRSKRLRDNYRHYITKFNPTPKGL